MGLGLFENGEKIIVFANISNRSQKSISIIGIVAIRGIIIWVIIVKEFVWLIGSCHWFCGRFLV